MCDECAKVKAKLARVEELEAALRGVVEAFEGTTLAPDDGSSVRWVRLIHAAARGRAALSDEESSDLARSA